MNELIEAVLKEWEIGERGGGGRGERGEGGGGRGGGRGAGGGGGGGGGDEEEEEDKPTAPGGAEICSASRSALGFAAAPLSINANAPLIIVNRDNALESAGRAYSRAYRPRLQSRARARGAPLEKRETKR
jgi:hypothetical protein